MFPVIFSLGPISIYSYGTMVALAFIACLFLLKDEAKNKGLSYQTIVDLCFWILICGLVGARLFYVILNWDYFRSYPLEVFKLYHGGLVIYGGIIAGTLTGLVYLKRKRLDVGLTLDVIAPYIVLAQAIGRIGCLLNGCCFGYPSVCGLYFPVHSEILSPIQAYSSLANLSIFIILKSIGHRISTKGNIFIIYLMLYSTKRFIVEFFRADTPKNILGFSVFQILSVVIFIIAGAILTIRKRCKNTNLS